MIKVDDQNLFRTNSDISKSEEIRSITYVSVGVLVLLVGVVLNREYSSKEGYVFVVSEFACCA